MTQAAVKGREAFTIRFSSQPLTLAAVYSPTPNGGVIRPIMDKLEMLKKALMQEYFG